MKLLLGIGVVLGAIAAFFALKRRGLPPERADVYLEDGTLQTFEAGTPEAERLLAPAREILGA